MSYKIIKPSPYEDLFKVSSTIARTPHNTLEVLKSLSASQKVFRSSFRVEARESAQKIASLLNKILKQRIGFLVELKDYSLVREKTSKGSAYLFKEFYEFQKLSLFEDIENRHKTNTLFSSEELTHLLYNVVYACYGLEKEKLPAWEISPSSIYVVEENGQSRYKLLLSNTAAISSIDTFVEELKKMPFERTGSPELIYSLLTNKPIDFNSIVKSNMFCLGFLILELGLGKKINSGTIIEKFAQLLEYV